MKSSFFFGSVVAMLLGAGTALAGSPVPVAAVPHHPDYDKLVDLWVGTQVNHPWTSGCQAGWSTNIYHCTWNGVTCNADGAVVGLVLDSCDLNGPAPASLWTFKHLKKLKLSNNSLTGSIDEMVSSMEWLEELDVNDAGFTASALPVQALCNLTAIGLRQVSGFDTTPSPFTGSVPTAYGAEGLLAWCDSLALLPTYDALSASAGVAADRAALIDLFTDTNGTAWGGCKSRWNTAVHHCTWEKVTCDRWMRVIKINLNNCQLDGLVPASVDSFSKLQVLDLGYNFDLTEPLPTSLGNLDSLKMLSFYLSGANSASPPVEICSLVDTLEFVEGLEQFAPPTPGAGVEGLKAFCAGIPSFVDAASAAFAPQFAPVEVSADRAALVQFFNTTDGANWNAECNVLWDTPMDHCLWTGVVCDPSGRVVTLTLPACGLGGEVVESFGDLDELRVLTIDNNAVDLTSPEIGDLPHIEKILASTTTGQYPEWACALLDTTDNYMLSISVTPSGGDVPTSTMKQHIVDWCAANGVVIEEAFVQIAHAPVEPIAAPVELNETFGGCTDGGVRFGYEFGEDGDSTCSGEEGSLCFVSGCATGYVAAGAGPVGVLRCQSGEYVNVVDVAGCAAASPDPVAGEADCAAFTPVPGYDTTCSDGTVTSRTSCNFTCTGSYTGTAIEDSVVCFDGTWYGRPVGCTPACVVPSPLCQTGGVGVPDGVVVEAVSLDHEFDVATCELRGGGRRATLLRTRCATGYRKESGRVGDAVCIFGQWAGSWARANNEVAVPVCVPNTDATQDVTCDCGKPGQRSVATNLRNGLTIRDQLVAGRIGSDRLDEIRVGATEWDCFRIPGSKRTLCTCDCDGQ